VKRHPFDLLSFVAGAVFVGMAVAFLVAGNDVLHRARWLLPVVLLVVGAAGLVSALRRD
jgi:cytochrome c oxidase subunit IV